MRVINRLKEKYQSLSPTVVASLWFTACNIIQRGLQFITMPIFTRIMTQEEYGNYSVFFSWFNLICVVTSLGIYNGTFNKAMIRFEKRRDEYISSIQSLTFLITVILGICCIYFRDLILKLTGFDAKTQLVMFLNLMFFPVLQYWSQEKRFENAYVAMVTVTLLNATASFVAGVVSLFITEGDSYTLIAVSVAVQVTICIVLACKHYRTGRKVYDREMWSWSLRMSIPLLPHYLAEILLGHCDRLMIKSICGSAQSGIYNIVYQISMVMTIVRTGINGAFTPWLYYSLKKKKYKEIRNATIFLVIMMWTMTAVFMLVGPEILRIAAPVSYYEAVIDIPAIMVACYFIFIYVLFINVEIYYEQNKYAALASIVAAVSNIILNSICIILFGYLAAGYTTMISYMIMAVMHYIFLRRIASQHEEVKEVFDIKFLVFSSAGIVLCGGCVLFLYNYTIIRCLILIIVITGVFIKRKKIKEMLTILKHKE